MRVVLHIGLHKTGTTSFQQWMRSNADTLLQSGALALPLPLDLLAGYSDVYDPDAAANYIDAAREAGANRIVVSHETLSQCEIEDYSELRRAFGDCDVQIVLVLRHWCSFLPSRWAQNCRRRDTIPLPAFLSELERDPAAYDEMRFDRVVNRARAGGFDDIQVLSYENASARAGLLPELIRTCFQGIETCDVDLQEIRANQGQPAIKIELLRLCNAIWHEAEGGHAWPMGAGLRINRSHYKRYDFGGIVNRGLRDGVEGLQDLRSMIAASMATFTLEPQRFAALADAVERDIQGSCQSFTEPLFSRAAARVLEYSPLTANDIPHDIKAQTCAYLSRAVAPS